MMIQEYKVVKPFDTLKVGDVLEYNAENDVYNFSKYFDEGDYSSLNSVVISSNLAKDYEKSGLLEAIKDVTEESKLNEKFNKLTSLISSLKNTYTQRNAAMDKRFKEGKIQACVKTEHDTVHFNLMKLLNKFEEIINE